MRIAARLAAAGLIGAIGFALVVGLVGRGHDVLLDDSPGCLLKSATGVDCAFCGMTHATVALGGGDWGGAHAAHPLAAVVLVGLIGLLAVIAAGRTDLLLRGRAPIVILAAVAAVWAVRLAA